MSPMAQIMIELDDETLGLLRQRAERQGVTPAEVARRFIADGAASPDPYAFIGSVDSDLVGAEDVDGFLDEHGFGT